MTDLTSKRFTTQAGQLITIEIPEEAHATVLDAILSHDPLQYGDYAEVAFRGAAGIQQFRSLGTGRNSETESTVKVPCQSLRFFTALTGEAPSDVVDGEIIDD